MEAKNKVFAFLNKHKVFFCLLVCLPLYHFLIVNQAKPFGVTEYTYPYFTVDFSMGFCDKFFLGELFHLIVGKYTQQAASIFVGIFYIIFVLLVAYLSERFFLAFSQNKKACLVIICFALTGPFSFNMFVKQFGMFDFFWALLFFTAIALLNSKYFKFFVPVLAVMMILVHYMSLIYYVAALLLIMLFYALKTDSKKERICYIALFVITFVICAGLTYYFFKNNYNNLVYSLDEFNRIQLQRGANIGYYDTTFYKEFPNELSSTKVYIVGYDEGLIGESSREVSNIFDSLVLQIKIFHKIGSLKRVLVFSVISLFPWLINLYILKGYIKKSSSFLKKGLTVLFILLCIISELIGCFLSTDTSRWMADCIIMLFSFTFLVLYFDYREGFERIEKLFSKTGYSFIYIFLFIYSSIVLDPYPFVFF